MYINIARGCNLGSISFRRGTVQITGIFRRCNYTDYWYKLAYKLDCIMGTQHMQPQDGLYIQEAEFKASKWQDTCAPRVVIVVYGMYMYTYMLEQQNCRIFGLPLCCAIACA